MTRALRSLLITLLATLLAFPVAAQPVDDETYALMQAARDLIEAELLVVHQEQQELLDQYRDPAWIIYDTGGKILTIDLKTWEEQVPILQLWLMFPGGLDITLSAMRRTDPRLYKDLIGNTATFRDVFREPGSLEAMLAIWSAIDAAERLRDRYAQSDEQRKAAFEKKMALLETQQQDLWDLLDFMDAELQRLRQETNEAAAPAEPEDDSEACEPGGESALERLCTADETEPSDEADEEGDEDLEELVDRNSLWEGCWTTNWGQLRLDGTGLDILGRLTWEDGDGEKHEIVHTYGPMIADHTDRLAGEFYGPLPSYEFECPAVRAGRSQWGTVRMDYQGMSGRDFHASYLPCGSDDFDHVQLDGSWHQTLETCDAAPDPEIERWLGSWETNHGTLTIQQSGAGLSGLLESGRGTAKLEIATGSPEVLKGTFVGPIDGPWAPEHIGDRTAAGECAMERAGDLSWGDIELNYSEGNDYWKDINDPRDDEVYVLWNPCDLAWREEIYKSDFGHGFYARRPDSWEPE